MIWLILLCALLSAAVLALSLKIIWMKKATEEIRLSFAEKLKGDTNTPITVSSGDRALRRLANDINIQLSELRRQKHRFVKGDTELKNAITNISHDLRTPLTAINGYLELLDKAEKSDTAAGYLEIIKNRTETLAQLTEELFRYSVIISPEYENSVSDVIVNHVLEESIAGFYAALQERNIVPAIRITENKVIRRMNKSALTRIFSNLLSNAVKYSGGDLEITLNDAGRITFSNTAPELTEVQVERLFDRFYTVENARKGTGLGLSIARVLTEQMNGTMTAQYEGGRLTLTIQLPEPVGD